jgi:glutamate---cysteine ligase / carboxylate-amine ligase
MTEQWLTIGIEEEFQIVDETGDLRAHIETLMASAKPVLGEELKPEFLQSFVEIGTKVCADINEARREIARLRGTLHSLLAESDLRLASAGTHPFAHWKDQLRTESDRYRELEDEMQDVIRELLIFGMHVHVGIPEPELRLEIYNEARYFLPHLMALSTSSPFWLGRDTGLKSYRGVVWSRFPRTGIPPDFSSYGEFENYVELLVKTNSIDDGKRIWWDLRPHHIYPTLEFRICDACTKIEETICVAALIQAVCAKLIKLRKGNLGFRKYLPTLVAENKWRAMRHGIHGKLIDFGKQAEVPFRVLAEELCEFVDDVIDDLGSREAVDYINTILSEGTSADRQLKVYRRTGDLKAVVDHLCEETVAAPVAD